MTMMIFVALFVMICMCVYSIPHCVMLCFVFQWKGRGGVVELTMFVALTNVSDDKLH